MGSIYEETVDKTASSGAFLPQNRGTENSLRRGSGYLLVETDGTRSDGGIIHN